MINLPLREPGMLRILQVTDLHLLDIERTYRLRPSVQRVWGRRVGGTAACRERTLRLMEELAISQQADLVVLTGDIIDGRGRTCFADFEGDLSALSASLERIGAPWVFVPSSGSSGSSGEADPSLASCAAGSSRVGDVAQSAEAAGAARSRAELLSALRRLPGCVMPADGNGFDFSLRIPLSGCAEFVDLLVFDAPQQRQPVSLSRQVVEATRHAISECEAPIARLAFVHRPVEAYDDAVRLVGRQGAMRLEAIPDGGLVKAASGKAPDQSPFHLDAIFCGCRHVSDCVRLLRRDGSRPMLLAYGRCGSFFPPSEHEGDHTLPFLRGARVIEIRARRAQENLPIVVEATNQLVEGASTCSGGSEANVIADKVLADDELASRMGPSPAVAVLRTWVAHESSNQPTDLVEWELCRDGHCSPRVITARS